MMSAQIEQSVTQKLDARIAAKLLQLADDFGENIAITQEQLARGSTLREKASIASSVSGAGRG